MRGSGLTLSARLADLRAEAASLSLAAFRPLAEKVVGYVEAAAIASDELVWVAGWMPAESRGDRPVIVAGADDSPAGFAYATFTRPELPAGAVGFLGVLHSAWQPSASEHVFFALGGGAPAVLEGLTPFNLVSKATFESYCEDRWAIVEGEHGAALRELLQHARSWDAAPDGVGQGEVEEVLLLPGFGAFARGWAVSLTRGISQIVLRIGDTVLRGDTTATERLPRPDVGQVFPAFAAAVGDAGFTVAFPGTLDEAIGGEVMLQIAWDDGSATNLVVQPSQVSRIGRGVTVEHVRRLFPAIAAEAFFPDFARAVRTAARTRADMILPVTVAPCASAVVLVAPENGADLHLMFDVIGRALGGLMSGQGIAVLARQGPERATVMNLFAGLRRRSDRPASLFFVTDPAAAGYALEAALAEIGADRFLFVGADTLLTEAGWRAAGTIDGTLTFVDVVDPALESDVGRAGFDCFAWSRAGWGLWLDGAEPLLGGPSMLPPPVGLLAGARRVSRGAQSMRMTVPSALTIAINRADRV